MAHIKNWQCYILNFLFEFPDSQVA